MATNPKNLEAAPDGMVVEPILIHGRVRSIDLGSRTAEFDWLGGKRLLRFGPEIGPEIEELKDRFVEVQGLGTYDRNGRLVEIDLTAIRHESDEIDQLLSDGQWRRFNPDDLVRTDEPFDVDDFLHDIYEARRGGVCSCLKQ